MKTKTKPIILNTTLYQKYGKQIYGTRAIAIRFWLEKDPIIISLN